MRIEFNISQSEQGKFTNACGALLRNVSLATEYAAEEAGWTLMSESLSECPIDTGTLAASIYLGIADQGPAKAADFSTQGASTGYSILIGYADKNYSFHAGKGLRSGIAGGGRGAVGVLSDWTGGNFRWLHPPTLQVNPKNGWYASSYAARIHEDLSMNHPNGGKAKFLEDPVLRWASGKFEKVATRYWTTAIRTFDDEVKSRHYNWRTKVWTDRVLQTTNREYTTSSRSTRKTYKTVEKRVSSARQYNTDGSTRRTYDGKRR